jgi:ribosomal protein S18 acetylase RimI-like enzyme
MSIDNSINHHPKLNQSTTTPTNVFTPDQQQQQSLIAPATQSTSVSITLINKEKIDLFNDLKLRFLNPNDINELKTLCNEWFPVDYPDSWYIDITSGKRFYSLAATFEDRIIGMIVAEIRNKRSCDKEDWYILSRRHPEDTQITYILSLGVFKEFRRTGVATLLLNTLYSYLKQETECKAVFLHVLCCNSSAIRFYEKNSFQQRSYLPNYSTIKGQLKDGFCYVKYMKDGEPAFTLADLWTLVKDYNPCRYIPILADWLRQTLTTHKRRKSKDFYRIS